MAPWSSHTKDPYILNLPLLRRNSSRIGSHRDDSFLAAFPPYRVKATARIDGGKLTARFEGQDSGRATITGTKAAYSQMPVWEERVGAAAPPLTEPDVRGIRIDIRTSL